MYYVCFHRFYKNHQTLYKKGYKTFTTKTEQLEFIRTAPLFMIQIIAVN